MDRFERFTFDIDAIFRYWHKIATDEMGKFGLKGAHGVYLVAMYRHPEGVTAAKLCELCGRDKADVSRMINIMEEKGFVKKDGAAYRAALKLTDEGVALAEHVRERALAAAEIAGKGVSEEHLELFYNVLETIAANLKKINREGLQVQ